VSLAQDSLILVGVFSFSENLSTCMHAVMYMQQSSNTEPSVTCLMWSIYLK